MVSLLLLVLLTGAVTKSLVVSAFVFPSDSHRFALFSSSSPSALLAADSRGRSFVLGSSSKTRRGFILLRSSTLESSSSTSSTSSSSSSSETLETTTTATETSFSGPPAAALLEPEFEAAMNAAKAKLQAAIPESLQGKMWPLLDHFVGEYMLASQASYAAGNVDECNPAAAAARFLQGVQYGMTYGIQLDPEQDTRFKFDVMHTALRGQDPDAEAGNEIDFYAFGCDFFRPYMDLQNSVILGKENLRAAVAQLEAGENVVFFANHQSEADPQVASTLLDRTGYRQTAEDLIYVAGHKVTTDPLAIPFSMGRNLICIHSKKHINADRATREAKQKQNLRAMSKMLDRLKAGGTPLWVAPSGGRDRRNVDTGDIPIAPFDKKTIDMFRLMGTKSKTVTHYYTLAMVTYDLCPPPDNTVPGVGEERNIRFVPVAMKCGAELPSTGGLESRQEFCNTAQEQCQADYAELLEQLASSSSSAASTTTKQPQKETKNDDDDIADEADDKNNLND